MQDNRAGSVVKLSPGSLARVAVIQGAFLPVPPIRGGAVEKLWHSLTRELAVLGHDVTYISRSFENLPESEFVEGVKIVRVGGFDRPSNPLRSLICDLIYSWRATKRICDVDIVVTNSFFSPILLWWSSQAKIYVSVHRLPRWQYFLYIGADRFQCVSSSVALELRRRAPFLAPRVKVIPNFVQGKGKANRPLIAQKCSNGEQVMLFVGRIHPEKGVDLLISAFKEFSASATSRWRLEVLGPSDIAAGGGGAEYLHSLRRLAENSHGTVVFREPIYDELRLSDVYSAASIFVYPSLARKGEAFGLAPLEAMAEGVPAIVSDLDCFRDFVVDGVNGWIFEAFGENPTKNLGEVMLKAESAWCANGESISSAAVDTARRFSLANVAEMLSEDFTELMSPP